MYSLMCLRCMSYPMTVILRLSNFVDTTKHCPWKNCERIQNIKLNSYIWVWWLINNSKILSQTIEYSRLFLVPPKMFTELAPKPVQFISCDVCVSVYFPVFSFREKGYNIFYWRFIQSRSNTYWHGTCRCRYYKTGILYWLSPSSSKIGTLQ